MSDLRLRELERRWLQSGTREDEVDLLAERARADQHGGVPRLEVAALVGYEPAREALARCVREAVPQRQAERTLGITRDDLLAWKESGCPAEGERRHDLIEVLRWANERDPWPEGSGPVRALARALHRAEPQAAVRAALGLAVCARGGKKTAALARLAEYLENPTPARGQTLRDSLQRLERRLDPTDERHAWRARIHTQAVLCAGRAAAAWDLNWVLGAVEAATQAGVAAARREWRHVTRHLVEAELLRAIRQEVLPWALGYEPRPNPRDRWRIEHGTDSGSARLSGALPRVVTTHTFRVVAESGRTVLSFSGESERFPNDDYQGTNRVTISADGTEAIAFELGGRVERHPLPGVSSPSDPI